MRGRPKGGLCFKVSALVPIASEPDQPSHLSENQWNTDICGQLIARKFGDPK